MTLPRARSSLVAVVTTLCVAMVPLMFLGGPAHASAYRLSTPHRLNASSPTSTSVKISWAKVRHATLYRMARARTSRFAHPTYQRSSHATLIVSRLRPSTTYWFRVRAIRHNGKALTAYSRAVRVRTRAVKVVTPAPTPTPTPTPASTPTPTPTPAVTPGPTNIRAASFNVLSVGIDKTSGEQLPWLGRRGAVLAQIMREHPDVLGLQEANQSKSFATRLKDGNTQYRDILNGLNGLGGHYAVTNDFPNNCVKADYSTNCTYQYRGASGDNRILYDTDTLSMVSQGSYYYAHQESGGTRNMTWAVFQVKASGSRFLFADTHLVPTSAKAAVREQQWRELITKINELKGSLPVITVGDFNTLKMDDLAATMLPLMKSAGYGDVLSQQYRVNPGVGIRAQHVINGWLNSYNHFKRDLTVYSYANRQDKTGNNIDWIFASNDLTVPEWETVVNYDPATLQATGTIPSDHDMVRATITIP